MSETTTGRKPALSTMRLPELKALATSMGIDMPAKSKKADYVAAIKGAISTKKTARVEKSASAQPAPQENQTTNGAPKQPTQSEETAPKSEKKIELDLPEEGHQRNRRERNNDRRRNNKNKLSEEEKVAALDARRCCGTPRRRRPRKP